jgi:predicted hydrocarbon binding protein
MSNIFLKGNERNAFSWDKLGNIKEGRGDMGEDMPVVVYRLMQYTMLDVLTKAYGGDQANEHFRQGGFLAGTEFAKNVLDLTTPFDVFLAHLQNVLKTMKIGILRMESFDPATGNIVLTVGQDLDCSGLPVTNETVCNYDEGFIAGILEAYTGKKYIVREVDCWANGDRVCRFNGVVAE